MLDVALQFLKGELDTYLTTRTGLDTSKITLSRIVDDSGKYAVPVDSVGVSIINIEEERVLKSHLPEYTYVNGQHVVSEPDLKLNLYVMFTANFQTYSEGLKYLSYVLVYFQSHPAFTQQDYPALDARIDKLVMELQSPSFDQLSQIWTFIGGKQLPSLLYKLRMLVLEPDAPTGVQPPITSINTVLHRP